MNLPNQLTVSRFVLTAFFLIALFIRFPGCETMALLLFSLAGITDYLDGRIARNRNLITHFGILMDPLADKILTCSAFIAFVEMHRMAAWMVVVIVAREFAITGLRLLAASRAIVLAAERFGKHKAISQIVSIIVTLVALCRLEWGSFGNSLLGSQIFGRPWIEGASLLTQWVAVGLTLYSGGAYLWKNRRLYLDHH